MIEDKKPDFEKAYVKANEILVRSNVISNFPFSPKDLIKELSKIKCRSYKKANKHGIDMTNFGSESAVIIKYGYDSIIFYDETKPETHTNFSILHEFGHDHLGHSFQWKNVEIYGKYEVETNYFSAQLLMPEQLIRELQRRGMRIDIDLLMKIFGVSNQAATKRIENLAKTNSEWYSRAQKEYDDIILLKYSEFINAICPNKNTISYEDELLFQEERNSWY